LTMANEIRFRDQFSWSRVEQGRNTTNGKTAKALIGRIDITLRPSKQENTC